MRVAVTGATGYVGRFVADALLRAGHDVRAWYRPASDRDAFCGPITWVEGSLRDEASATDLLRGVDALVHAAFEHVPGRYRGGEGDDLAGFLAANEQGSRRLIATAERLGLERVVFLSSRAVYGPRHRDRRLDEAHPTTPDTHYGRYKLAIERAVVAGAQGRAWASLRPTGVFGLTRPLRRSKWYDVLSASLAGSVPPARAGTEVAGEDLAAAVLLLLRAAPATVSGRAFNVSDVVVSHRAVTRLGGGVLAPPAPPPAGIMATTALQSLGWRPRGWSAVENTVDQLVRCLQGA